MQATLLARSTNLWYSGQSNTARIAGDGHHQDEFDKREGPDSARFHDLVGAPFACSFRRM